MRASKHPLFVCNIASSDIRSVQDLVISALEWLICAKERELNDTLDRIAELEGRASPPKEERYGSPN
jgi:hypothetical protein